MISRTLALFAVVLAACGSKGGAPGAGTSASAAPSQSKVMEAAGDEDVASATSTAKAADSPTVAIPAGKFESGSTPGDKGRNPITEPALATVELGAFDIDRSPYPNEIGKPPMTGVPRVKAEELCQARGRRLCSELEWERACKGPNGDAYAGSAGWNPSCAKDPSSCASGFGVVGMGSIREIVKGEIAPVKELTDGGPVARGAAPDAPASDHRCAKRTPVDLGLAASDLGFRCCGGPENAATIPAPQWKQTFERVSMPADKAAELFATVPQLRKLGSDIKYFDEAGAAKWVVRNSDAGDVPSGITLTTSPLRWSPVPGDDLLVLVGLAGEDSFIVAFYELPDDRYRIGSTLILHGDKGPVVLGFNGYDGKRAKDKSYATLDWATCWKCQSESGLVTYKDGHVTITAE